MGKVGDAYKAVGLKKEYKEAKKWASRLEKALENAGARGMVDATAFVDMAVPSVLLRVGGEEIARVPAPSPAVVGEIEAERVAKVYAAEVAKIAVEKLREAQTPEREDIEEDEEYELD